MGSTVIPSFSLQNISMNFDFTIFSTILALPFVFINDRPSSLQIPTCFFSKRHFSLLLVFEAYRNLLTHISQCRQNFVEAHQNFLYQSFSMAGLHRIKNFAYSGISYFHSGLILQFLQFCLNASTEAFRCIHMDGTHQKV